MNEAAIIFLTSAVVLATAIVGFMSKLNKDVQEIHVMVNSYASEQADRIEQLAQALKAAGLEVPDKPKKVDP